MSPKPFKSPPSPEIVFSATKVKTTSSKVLEEEDDEEDIPGEDPTVENR